MFFVLHYKALQPQGIRILTYCFIIDCFIIDCFHHDNYCTTTDTYFTETPNGTSTGIAGLGFDVQRGPSSTDATCVFGTDRQIRGPLLYMRQYGLL